MHRQLRAPLRRDDATPAGPGEPLSAPALARSGAIKGRAKLRVARDAVSEAGRLLALASTDAAGLTESQLDLAVREANAALGHIYAALEAVESACKRGQRG
jgi:hypothetical protein